MKFKLLREEGKHNIKYAIDESELIIIKSENSKNDIDIIYLYPEELEEILNNFK